MLLLLDGPLVLLALPDPTYHLQDFPRVLLAHSIPTLWQEPLFAQPAAQGPMLPRLLPLCAQPVPLAPCATPSLHSPLPVSPAWLGPSARPLHWRVRPV